MAAARLRRALQRRCRSARCRRNCNIINFEVWPVPHPCKASGMMIDGLPLPARLVSLVKAGIWPRTESDFRAQHVQPRVSKDRVRLFSAQDTRIDLYAYDHLCLLLKEVEADEEYCRSNNLGPESAFWATHGDLENIDPSPAISIGDFGLGSDSPSCSITERRSAIRRFCD